MGMPDKVLLFSSLLENKAGTQALIKVSKQKSSIPVKVRFSRISYNT